ncbi:hypothetical protein FRC17_001951, partial [Serendipita sp. 399]
ISDFFQELIVLKEAGTESKPFRAFEDEETLKHVLVTMEPSSRGSFMLKCSINMIRAGARYRAHTIIKKFEAGLFEGSTEIQMQAMRAYPAELLQISLDYDLPNIGKAAVQELLGRPLAFLDNLNERLPSLILEYVKSLRSRKQKMFRSWIDALVECHLFDLGVLLRARQSPALPTCAGCVSAHAHWVLFLEKIVVLEPTWVRFKREFILKKPILCTTCGRRGYLGYQEWTTLLQKWDKQLKKLEEQLIMWPIAV